MARNAAKVEADASDPSARPPIRGFTVALAAGAFLAVAGAFGSYESSLLQRFLYWVPLMLVGAVWGAVCAAAVFRRAWFRERLWAGAIVLVLAIGLPFTFVVWWATAAFFGFPLRAEALGPTAINVLTVAAAVTVLNLVVGARLRSLRPATAPVAKPRFLDRLPPRLRGAELYAVEAEDHYLRVHTDRGSDLLLLRMSDAVAELEGTDGARVHRSWWVARSAVIDVERGDGRAVLTLKTGLKAPVSRTRARDLRAAGWW